MEGGMAWRVAWHGGWHGMQGGMVWRVAWHGGWDPDLKFGLEALNRSRGVAEGVEFAFAFLSNAPPLVPCGEAPVGMLEHLGYRWDES